MNQQEAVKIRRELTRMRYLRTHSQNTAEQAEFVSRYATDPEDRANAELIIAQAAMVEKWADEFEVDVLRLALCHRELALLLLPPRQRSGG